MNSSSQKIALLLAVCIAVVTTAFLSLVNEVATSALIVTFTISASSSYILSWVVLEFLIFREINNIYDLFKNLRKSDMSSAQSKKSNPFNPLKQINDQISSYTTLKQNEIDQLKKMEAFRKEFIADVSHELKTPIFAAQGFVHTLLDGAVKDKNVRNRFLKKAAKSLDDLDILVQDLLILSQIETGEIKMHFEDFDIKHLTGDIFEQFENKADKKNIKLHFAEGTPEKVLVYGDWQRINQVMTNLISNAIKYSGEKKEVTVEFDVEDEQITTHVRDNGEGIPEEDVGRVFERFYRVDKSRSREKGGTGLGLAIVKHIIEGHNSKVEVKSVQGDGCDFKFILPRTQEEDSED